MISQSSFVGSVFFPLTCTLTGSQNGCAISNHAKGVEKCHRQVFPSLDVRVMFPPDFFLSLCSLFDPTRVGNYTKILILAREAGVGVEKILKDFICNIIAE